MSQLGYGLAAGRWNSTGIHTPGGLLDEFTVCKPEGVWDTIWDRFRGLLLPDRNMYQTMKMVVKSNAT